MLSKHSHVLGARDVFEDAVMTAVHNRPTFRELFQHARGGELLTLVIHPHTRQLSRSNVKGLTNHKDQEMQGEC